MMQSSDSRSFPIRPRIYIPKYDPQNIIHVEIADLCKIMHKKYNDAQIIGENQKKAEEYYIKLIEQSDQDSGNSEREYEGS